jgi:hypothetical protein
VPHSLPPPTISSIPRASRRNIGAARGNAIQGRRALRPRPRVILPGNKGLSRAHPKDFGRKSALPHLIKQGASGL